MDTIFNMHIWRGKYEECKGVEQAKAIITCKKLILKEGHIKTYKLGGLLEFCFTFCVSCHTGCLKHWRKAGAYPLVPASVVLVLRVTFFVDQGGRGSFSIRVWVGPGVLGFLRQPPSGKTGVQKYIGCRTRPHGGGSGEGG